MIKRRLTRQQRKENRLRKLRGILALLCITLSFVFLYQPHVTLPQFDFQNKVQAQETKIVSPLPLHDLLDTVITPTATPAPTYQPPDPSYRKIAAEIRRVFGPYSDRAMQLLSCENSALDPDITNTNTDGSIDYGVFQINNYWQQIYNPAFLTDYTINIRLAYNIFARDGYSFNLWTCGKKLGI